MLLKQVKNKIKSAEMRNFKGMLITVSTIDDDIFNIMCYLLFKQKILLEKREINKQEAMKALDLGYSVKIINDKWCEDEQVLSIWKYPMGKKLLIYDENGSRTDEYLPEEYLTPNVKYFLEGTVHDGDYVPF